MAKPPPDAATVLQILLDRVTGIPAEDSARKLGYKPKTLSDIAGKYQLEDIERQLRAHITGQAAEFSPEAIALNQESETRLKKISDLIYTGAEQTDALRFESEVDKMRYLELAARGIEGTRQSRLKIAGVLSDAKKKKDAKPAEEEGYKSAYADLANDDEEDDEGD